MNIITLVQSLKCHSNYPESCDMCPYNDYGREYCFKRLCSDAAETIKLLTYPKTEGSK